MLKRYVGLMALALLMLVGCSTSGPNTVDNVEDIIGTWKRIGPGPQQYLQAFEDGTIHLSSNPDLLEARPETRWETRFEGTQLLMKESTGYCNDPVTGTYEVNILENGNLGFVAIDDECSDRASILRGANGTEGTVEYEPVP